jgi:hypothetical protein
MSQVKNITKPGWVKVQRSILDHWMVSDLFALGVWTLFLLKANYKDKKWKCGNEIITIERGTFVSSETKLAEECRCSRKKIRGLLHCLRIDGMVTTKRTGNGTTFIINNYSKYQDYSGQSENKGPALGTTEGTTEDTTQGQPGNTTKEYKKEKKEEKVSYPSPESPIRLTQRQIDRFLAEWSTSEFRYWLNRLAEWHRDSPQKFAKKKDHGMCIRKWRSTKLEGGVVWYDSPKTGPGYYKTYDVERWQGEDRKIN